MVRYVELTHTLGDAAGQHTPQAVTLATETLLLTVDNRTLVRLTPQELTRTCDQRPVIVDIYESSYHLAIHIR